MALSIRCPALALALLLGACADLPVAEDTATPEPEAPDCTQRLGYCFDAAIAGVPVVPLQSTAPLEPHKGRVEEIDEVRWQTILPVSGEMSLELEPNPYSLEAIGRRPQFEVMVVPLGDYDIDTEPTLRQDPTAGIGGAPALTQANRITSNRLPPGEYLFRIRVAGDQGWDRKTVYVLVE